MGTVAKVALGVVIGGVVLVGGCVAVVAFLAAAGTSSTSSSGSGSSSGCADLVEFDEVKFRNTSERYAEAAGYVRNLSSERTIGYLEIGVYVRERSGEVKHTEWTNETDLRAGERRSFSKMFMGSIGSFDKVSVDVRTCRW